MRHELNKTTDGTINLATFKFVAANCSEVTNTSCQHTLLSFDLDKEMTCQNHPNISWNLPLRPPTILTTTEIDGNGTFCLAEYPKNQALESFECNLSQKSGFEGCTTFQGSHSKTFWSYFVVSQLQAMGINPGFSLFDASSLEYADRYNGQYSMIFLVKTLVQPIVTAVSGYLIIDNGQYGKS